MQEKPAKNLKDYNGEDRIISSTEMSLKLKESPESILQVKSFIPSLDSAVDGFRDGELYTISGPTKNGKSLFAQSLTVSFIKQQYYPLWFSFEIPVRQFLSQFPESPFIYLPAKLKAHVLPWIQERVLEAFEKYHCRIVFIDHLHYLFDIGRAKNPSLEIGSVIRRLKTLAVQGGFLIFLLAHTVKNKSEDNLSYESIRDSSFISQESDSVFMIKRTPREGENTAKLSIEFHRRTGILEKMIELVKVNGLLEERILRDEGSREERERRDWV